MTLLDITFELQKPLTTEQLRRLGEFANHYGLRCFRTDAQGTRLTFEYDASRLQEAQMAHILGLAGIAIVRRVDVAA